MRNLPGVVLLLFSSGFAACGSEHSAAGRWHGTIINAEADLNLAIKDGVATGSISSTRGDRVQLIQVNGSARRDSVALILTVSGEDEAASLNAAVRGDSLIGVLRGGGDSIPVALSRVEAN